MKITKKKKNYLITKLLLFATISPPTETCPRRQTGLISGENIVATSTNKSFFMVLIALLRLRAERSADVKVEEIKRSWRVTKPMRKHHQPGALHIRMHVHLRVSHRRAQPTLSITRHPPDMDSLCLQLWPINHFQSPSAEERNAFQWRKIA